MSLILAVLFVPSFLFFLKQWGVFPRRLVLGPDSGGGLGRGAGHGHHLQAGRFRPKRGAKRNQLVFLLCFLMIYIYIYMYIYTYTHIYI